MIRKARVLTPEGVGAVFGANEQRNTLFVRLDEGSHLIECAPHDCTPLTVPIRPVLEYPEGTTVVLLLSGAKGTIVTYASDEVCLRMPDGMHRWFDSREVEPLPRLLN
jgi:hypothetical protein